MECVETMPCVGNRLQQVASILCGRLVPNIRIVSGGRGKVEY